VADFGRQARWTRWALVAGVVVSVTVSIGGCGGGDSVSPEEAEQQAEQAAREAVQQERERQRQQEQSQKLEALKKKVADLVEKLKAQSASGGAASSSAPPPASSGVPSDATSCGPGVYVNSNTTCPFAANVLAGYLSAPGNTFPAHSPVTGQDYTMTCSGSAPVTCTGGNDAAVYIDF